MDSLITNYSERCREAAAHWLKIHDEIGDTCPEAARFALMKAVECHNEAQRQECLEQTEE